MVLIATYDLHNPGRDYEDVKKVLKSARSWAHPQGSVWLLDTDRSREDWVERLGTAGDQNDEYFVCQLRQNWCSIKMGKDAVDWLKNSNRTW